jgi:uncharacterized protein
MKKLLTYTLWGALCALGGWYAAIFIIPQLDPQKLLSPLVEQTAEVEKPFEQFSIPNLRSRSFQPSQIKIERELEKFPDYTSYVFSYTTLNRKMSGLLNIPTNHQLDSSGQNSEQKAIILVRGWAPPDGYTTGSGTRNAAAVFARNGYVTLSPDFFSYGESDPEPDNSWLARFEKPVAVIELLETVRQVGIPNPANGKTYPINKLGLWAHSNGGQITLVTLQVLGEPIPATLWAPVTAPFPYSVLYFSVDHEDEGKSHRAWLAQLEKDYDVFDFTVTKHLDSLNAPLLLHHGTADADAPYRWSVNFAELVRSENKRREQLVADLKNNNLATESAQETSNRLAVGTRLETAANNSILNPIDFEFFSYQGADHNMRPSWNTVIQRDLEFFEKNL